MEQYWNIDQITEVDTEMTSPNQLEHTSARGSSVVRVDSRGNGMAEDGEHFLTPDMIRGTSDNEPVLVPFMCSSKKEMKAVDTVSKEDSAEGDTIMVGVVGSAAPWFLTGWTNDVEVEFMIDTGCQVTILATSVFDRMCDIHPEVRNGLVPCAQRLVSADSSPLTVMGRINLNVVFPGLRCDMWCVVAGIGTEDYWVRKPYSRAYLTNSTCEQASYGRMVAQPYNCISKNRPHRLVVR